MTQITIAGQSVDLTDEGYLTDATQWNKEVAVELAKTDGFELGDDHFKVLDFLRDS
ncbi:MAG: sulfur relay protein DsrC, partial [Bacteroidetes bacterium]